MIQINQNTFEIVLSGFNKLLNEKIDNSKNDFKNHPSLIKHENYKYDIIEDAKSELLLKLWKESDIGTGSILKNVKNAIDIKSNNLIDWRKKDDFKKLKANKENEKFLFDFFKSKIKDEFAFNSFMDIGFTYQLIAYLFFIKNHQKYMPISQKKFDEIFSSINIDFKTSHNCSWENYLEYNEIIKHFKIQLSKRFMNVTLLDAHSFLWIYGFQLDEPEVRSLQINNVSIQKESDLKNTKQEKSIPKLEIYSPKNTIEIEEDLSEDFVTEVDYIEIHRKQMEIGELAEKIVLESEISFLNSESPDLAKKVRLVSNNPKLGFDILSYEADGKQKQIEVKAVSVSKNSKSFILTRNEFLKSKTYSNYYVYCVTELNSENPKIFRIKNPDFENNQDFSIEPLTYKIKFE